MYRRLHVRCYVALPVALFRVALDEFQWKGLLVRACMAHTPPWTHTYARHYRRRATGERSNTFGPVDSRIPFDLSQLMTDRIMQADGKFVRFANREEPAREKQDWMHLRGECTSDCVNTSHGRMSIHRYSLRRITYWEIIMGVPIDCIVIFLRGKKMSECSRCCVWWIRLLMTYRFTCVTRGKSWLRKKRNPCSVS